MFVIRHKTNGQYMKGGRDYRTPTWVDDINSARVFARKCDASNSITGNFTGYYHRTDIKPSHLEIVEVRVSVHDVNEPDVKVDISPEILERATRYMMNEQARAAGAPDSLVTAFEDLNTNEVVKLVTTLYGKK